MYKPIAKIPASNCLKYVYRVHGIQTSSGHNNKVDCKVPQKKPCPKTGSGRGFYKMLGAVVIGTSAVVAVAKYDDGFRKMLKKDVPAFEEFISFITAEETTHVDYIMRSIKSWNVPLNDRKEDADATAVKKVLGAFQHAIAWLKRKIAVVVDDYDLEGKLKSNNPPCNSDGKPYNPKKAVEKRLKELTQEKKEKDEERKKEMGDLKKAEDIARRNPEPQEGPKGKPVRDRGEIEKDLTDQFAKAILAYTNGTCTLRNYTDSVKAVVESSVEKQDPKIWPELQKKTAKKDETVKKLSDQAVEAEALVVKLNKELNDARLKKYDEMTIDYVRAMKTLKDAKDEFIREKNMANVTNTYWTLVKEAREHFQEQLSTLFPDLTSANKSMKLAEAEMDLFILYAFQTILHYQKELAKLDETSKLNLKSALEKSKIAEPELIECVIETELKKEKKKICKEYKKKLQDLKMDCEKKANESIKSHNAMHSTMLQDALDRKEEEVKKKMKKQLDEQLIGEKEKYQEGMAALLGNLKGADELMKKVAVQEKMAVDAQLLWSACEGLVAAITCERDCASVTMRALNNEIQWIQSVASKDDELVQAVVAAIPKIAYDRGVFGEPALKERFANTARVARHVALLPEGGSSLAMMLISYLQSALVVSPKIPMPCVELAGHPPNLESLNTFEILQLSKYWMDRGDWYQVLRYMNLLKGASRVVAQDFLDEVKIFLETKQAADVLTAHASATAMAR